MTDLMPVAFADIARLEQMLGLPSNFTTKLLEEDDWSFIIKSQAVIEAAVSYLLGSLTDARLSRLNALNLM